MNPTDAAILAAYRRRIDGDGYATVHNIEFAVADALGLDWLRVALALDRAHVVRAYRGRAKRKQTA